VRDRRKEMHRTRPGGNGNRGFSREQGSRQAHSPTHLLAGAMVCASFGATIAQVSGKDGGYYGCLAATKGACDNKTLVRRTLAEKVILGAVREQIEDPEHIAYVLHRVEEEIARLRSDLPDTLKLKEAELTAEQRRRRQLRRLHRRGPRQPGTRQGPGRDRAPRRPADRRGRRTPPRTRQDLQTTSHRVDQRPTEQRPAGAGTAHGTLGANPGQPPRTNPARGRHPRYRPALLPRRHDSRRPGPHRRTAPRWCGGRFEFFAKVETAGTKDAKTTEFAGRFSRGGWPSCGRVDLRRPRPCGRLARTRAPSGPSQFSLF
jgi:hypothetical protein